jgi:hypothetical protein
MVGIKNGKYSDEEAQRRYIRRDPPRLVFGQQLGGRA